MATQNEVAVVQTETKVCAVVAPAWESVLTSELKIADA
jgi:hypothetical protein